jgi:hypothetical protein
LSSAEIPRPASLEPQFRPALSALDHVIQSDGVETSLTRASK